MLIVAIFAIIGAILGAIIAFTDDGLEELIPDIFKGGVAFAILGFIAAGILSVGVWIFTDDSALHLEVKNTYTLAENEESELLYFNLTHDESTTYLYFMNEEQKIQKVRLVDLTVCFIDDETTPYIESATWQYNNKFFERCTFKPLNAVQDVHTLYISESDWLKYTDGGVQDVRIITPEGDTNE